MSGGNIARRWRDLSGKNRWKGLLDPLDNDLRQYLIHYGEMAQATYDTFISQRFSMFAGGSRFNMKNMFSGVGLRSKNNKFVYDTVKYLYATSNISVPQSFIMRPMAQSGGTGFGPMSLLGRGSASGGTTPSGGSASGGTTLLGGTPSGGMIPLRGNIFGRIRPTSGSPMGQSNWMGYIAVASDQAKQALGRRDICVAWRGTIEPLEWIKDYEANLVPATDILGVNKQARVHSGFHSVYTSANPLSQYSKTSARQQVLEGVKELVNKYGNEEISVTVTGHSLGAALATLSAADIAANAFNRSDGKANKGCPVTAFAFACPRTGDAAFKQICDSLEDLRILRITNAPDLVPKVPPLAIGYSEVGENLDIDTRKSTYVKFGGFAISHDLEMYLHGIAGTQGRNRRFSLNNRRDIALVNKHIDGLKDQYMVPPNWWRQANTGMMQQKDGKWALNDHEAD